MVKEDLLPQFRNETWAAHRPPPPHPGPRGHPLPSLLLAPTPPWGLDFPTPLTLQKDRKVSIQSYFGFDFVAKTATGTLVGEVETVWVRVLWGAGGRPIPLTGLEPVGVGAKRVW